MGAYREECGRRGKINIKMNAEQPVREDEINYYCAFEEKVK